MRKENVYNHEVKGFFEAVGFETDEETKVFLERIARILKRSLSFDEQDSIRKDSQVCEFIEKEFKDDPHGLSVFVARIISMKRKDLVEEQEMSKIAHLLASGQIPEGMKVKVIKVKGDPMSHEDDSKHHQIH